MAIRQPGPAGETLKAIVPAAWNRLTEQIIGCAMQVHTELGPGLLEKVYEDALCYEFSQAGITCERQVPFRIPYKDTLLSEQIFDLVVEGLIIVELKSTERLHEVHLAQLLSYLRATSLPLGLLINFNVHRLTDGIHRRINAKSRAFITPPPMPRITTPHTDLPQPSPPPSLSPQRPPRPLR